MPANDSRTPPLKLIFSIRFADISKAKPGSLAVFGPPDTSNSPA
jgi:hypothetical protein